MYEDDKSAVLARFRALMADDDEFSISHFVLALIRELMDGQQKPPHEIIATIADGADGPDRKLCHSALEWLASLGILNNPDGQVQLTLAGRRSLTSAAGSDEPLSEFLSSGDLGPDRARANHMVLAILRAHLDSGN